MLELNKTYSFKGSGHEIHTTIVAQIEPDKFIGAMFRKFDNATWVRCFNSEGKMYANSDGSGTSLVGEHGGYLVLRTARYLSLGARIAAFRDGPHDPETDNPCLIVYYEEGKVVDVEISVPGKGRDWSKE